MPRKKKTEQQPDSLVNHTPVRHALKVLNATPLEPDSGEAVESPFAEPKVESPQAPGKEKPVSQQDNVPEASTSRDNLRRQCGALADGDTTITSSQARRR